MGEKVKARTSGGVEKGQAESQPKRAVTQDGTTQEGTVQLDAVYEVE